VARQRLAAQAAQQKGVYLAQLKAQKNAQVAQQRVTEYAATRNNPPVSIFPVNGNGKPRTTSSNTVYVED
jgi:hypothetical protein